jgi:hypothetical protein
MTILFTPKAFTFAAVSAAGSGTLTRWTYTVPAGKRAVLTDVSIFVAANANAANTTLGLIRCSIGGVVVRIASRDGSGVANPVSNERACHTDLQAGDNVNGLTVNTGANGVSIIVDAVIREYL